MNSNNNSFFIGKVLHELVRVDSTNNYALNLISKEKVVEGTVVSALEQFAGRGQMGTGWKSQAGLNLTLSIILLPKFLLAKDQFFLNQAISLGVCKTVQSFIDAPVQIKWPNDIYINDLKTGGILIQNILSGSSIQKSIIGIGLNINQTDFPNNLPNPTSLSLSANKKLDLVAIRNTLFSQIEGFYLQLKANKHALLKVQYLDKLYQHNILNTFFRKDGTSFTGKIIDIAHNGALIIAHTDNHKLEQFMMKEVSLKKL